MSSTAPLTILEFVDAIQLRLFPVQRFVLKVFYGLPLDSAPSPTLRSLPSPYTGLIRVDSPFTNWTCCLSEIEYLKYLYDEGRANVSTVVEEPMQLVLCLGRRGGSTTLACVIAAYEMYRVLRLEDPHKHYGLGPGCTIRTLLVTKDRHESAFASQEIGDMLRRAKGTGVDFSELCLGTLCSTLKFQAKKGKGRDTVELVSKSHNAKGWRGRTNRTVIFNDIAFYPAGRARDLMLAAVPSVSAFWKEGKIALISSPATTGDSGMLRTAFKRAMYNRELDAAFGTRRPVYEVALQIPSWEANPSLPKSFFQAEREALAKKGKEAIFDAEFGAQLDKSSDDPDPEPPRCTCEGNAG